MVKPAATLSIILNVAVIILSIVVLLVPIWSGAGFAGGPVKKYDVTLWKTAVEDGLDKSGTLTETAVEWDQICQMSSQTAPAQFLAACDMILCCRAMLILGMLFAAASIGGIAAAVVADNGMIEISAVGMGSLSFLCEIVTLGLVCAMGSSKHLNGPGFFLLVVSAGCSFLVCIFTSIGFYGEIKSLAKLVAQSEKRNLAAKKANPNAAGGGSRAQRAAKAREHDQKEFMDREAASMRLQQRNVLKDGVEHVMDVEGGGDSRPGSPGAQEPEPVGKGPPVMLQKVLFYQQSSEDDEIPLEMLEGAFREIDEDESGSIDLAELVEALRQCGLEASKAATEIIIKEIDKNASGDVDIHEFIEFFRHVEDLDRFATKSAARQQFLSFLMNFCFLADIIVVGIILMLFIKKDEAESPDDYAIMKNVLIACSAVLGILFILVICLPIFRLTLGPSASKLGEKYELSKQLKSAQKRLGGDPSGGGGGGGALPSPGQGPRGAAWASGMAKEQEGTGNMEASLYGKKSYRVNVRNNAAALTNAPQFSNERQMVGFEQPPRNSRTSGIRNSNTFASLGSEATTNRGAPVNNSRRYSQYDPSAYRIAEGVAMQQDMPTSFSPMQVRDISVPRNQPATLPGASPMLTDANFPMY